QIVLELLDVLAFFPDHNTRTGGVNRNAGFFRRTFDNHLRNTRLFQTVEDVFTDRQIFMKKASEIGLVGVPAGIPGTVNANAQTDRIYFLTHYSASSRSQTTMRMLENGLTILPTRPRARARQRFITNALPTVASLIKRRSTSSW